jgi:hypothetical protein
MADNVILIDCQVLSLLLDLLLDSNRQSWESDTIHYPIVVFGVCYFFLVLD